MDHQGVRPRADSGDPNLRNARPRTANDMNVDDGNRAPTEGEAATLGLNASGTGFPSPTAHVGAMAPMMFLLLAGAVTSRIAWFFSTVLRHIEDT